MEKSADNDGEFQPRGSFPPLRFDRLPLEFSGLAFSLYRRVYGSFRVSHLIASVDVLCIRIGPKIASQCGVALNYFLTDEKQPLPKIRNLYDRVTAFPS